MSQNNIPVNNKNLNKLTFFKSNGFKKFLHQHAVRIVCILLIIGLLFASKYLYIYV